MGIENIDDLKPGEDPRSEGIVKRRAELRRLSELRGLAGFTAYPDARAVKELAARLNISEVEAHDQLMHDGERILNEQNEESK